jgi:NAD(P)-dependent dehydrogenase (short-subunit alcohol dehydrogenase family)
MGHLLVRTALKEGDMVTAVGRIGENNLENMQGWHTNCLGLLCDVRIRDTVCEVVEKTIATWGRADVIAK